MLKSLFKKVRNLKLDFKSKKLRRWGLFCLVILTILVGCRWHVIKSAQENVFAVGEIEQIDGCSNVLILGARVRDDGELTNLYKERAMAAVDLYHQGKACAILISGEKVIRDGKIYDETEPVKKYLISQQVDDKIILLDGTGFDTFESLKNAKEKFSWKDVLVVTQEFHLSRAVYIGQELGLDAKGYVAYKFPYPSKTEKWKDQAREFPAAVKAIVEVKILK